MPPKKKTATKNKRSTKAVFAQRVQQVLRIRLAGAQLHDLREYAQENDPETGRPWNVSDNQLWRYVQASDELLEKSLEKDRPRLINRHLAQRMAVYAQAIQTGDLRTALTALKDEADLLGLYPAAKLEHTGEIGFRLIEELVVIDARVTGAVAAADSHPPAPRPQIAG